MASTLKPFRATYYNPLQVKNPGACACPPYDVINKQELKVLRNKSPYNFSHVLIADNKNYLRPAKILDQWFKKQVLIDDTRESLYLYDQKFKVEGKVFKRFGILSLLRMDKKGIFPHERTHTAPKEDRKRIIKSTKAHLSPIFVIAASPLNELMKIYKLHSRTKPFIKLKSSKGVINRIWKISNKKEITRICREVDKCKLVIADGHHRFEVSLDYFKKNKAKFKDLNYILAYIAGYQEGLAILPTHRVLALADKDQEFFRKLEKYFKLDRISPDTLDKKLKTASRFCLGIYRKNNFYFLQLKNPDILVKMFSKLYRELDTYIFHNLVLPLFKLESKFEYTHSLKEAKALAGKKKTAFILRAASLESVFKISSKGFRMPQKSTYFYPKLLSGLVIRRFKK